MIALILLAILGYLIYRDTIGKEKALEKAFEREVEIEKIMNKWR